MKFSLALLLAPLALLLSRVLAQVDVSSLPVPQFELILIGNIILEASYEFTGPLGTRITVPTR